MFSLVDQCDIDMRHFQGLLHITLICTREQLVMKYVLINKSKLFFCLFVFLFVVLFCFFNHSNCVKVTYIPTCERVICIHMKSV